MSSEPPVPPTLPLPIAVGPSIGQGFDPLSPLSSPISSPPSGGTDSNLLSPRQPSPRLAHVGSVPAITRRPPSTSISPRRGGPPPPVPDLPPLEGLSLSNSDPLVDSIGIRRGLLVPSLPLQTVTTANSPQSPTSPVPLLPIPTIAPTLEEAGGPPPLSRQGLDSPSSSQTVSSLGSPPLSSPLLSPISPLVSPLSSPVSPLTRAARVFNTDAPSSSSFHSSSSSSASSASTATASTASSSTPALFVTSPVGSPVTSPRTDTDEDEFAPGSPNRNHIGSRMLIHTESRRASLIPMREDSLRMIIRSYIADDNHLADMGLNGTFKTLALKPGMTTDDMRQLLLEKITRGMKVEQKTTILSTCSHYHFDLKNKTTGVEERLDSTTHPYQLFRALPRQEDHYLIFQPPGVPIRAYLPDDQLLSQLGLNNTFKSLFISLSTTTIELQAMMTRKMTHGLNAQQTEQLEIHLRSFHMCLYTAAIARPLGRNERPLTLLRNDPASARFLFQPSGRNVRRLDPRWTKRPAAAPSMITAAAKPASVASELDDDPLTGTEAREYDEYPRLNTEPQRPDLHIRLPRQMPTFYMEGEIEPDEDDEGDDEYEDEDDADENNFEEGADPDEEGGEETAAEGEGRRRRRVRKRVPSLLRNRSLEKIVDLHSPQTPPASPSSQRLWEIASAAAPPTSPSSHSTDSDEFKLRPPGLPSGTADEWIIVNVGGHRYETYRSTLSRFPDSLLLSYIKPDNIRNGEYRIDRNGRAFEGVLEYCRTGQIFCPPSITEEQMAAEFTYFRFPTKIFSMLHGSTFARQFREPEKWKNEAFALFHSVGPSFMALIEKESFSGESYQIRVALLSVEELQQCEGKLGDIIRGPVRLAPHPSKGGGWCLVIEHARRYFIDQLRKCFEDLDFKTNLEVFRYCGCPPCTKHHLMTRYLVISWADRAKSRLLLKCEKLLETLESGVSVWVLN